MKQQLQLWDMGRVFFWNNILVCLHQEAGREFHWEKFAFAFTVSVLSERDIFKMIKNGDDRQQYGASKYKIRQRER